MSLIVNITAETVNIVEIIIQLGILLFAVVAFFLSYKEYRHNKKKAQLEYTLNIAHEYADLIKKMSFITSLVKATPIIHEIINSIDLCDMNAFNRTEMDHIFSESDRDELNKFFGTHPLPMSTIKSVIRFEQKSDSLTAQLQATSAFRDVLCSVLNSFECIGMALMTKIADEETLYQPLHKSYLATTKILYFSICNSNVNISDKLFVNATDLFKIWRDRDSSKKQLESDIELAAQERVERQRRQLEISVSGRQTL